MNLLNTFRIKRCNISRVLYISLVLIIFGIFACSTKNAKVGRTDRENVKIADLEYKAYSDKSQLVLKSNDTLRYTAYKQTNPNIVNIELYGTYFGKSDIARLKRVSDKTVHSITVSTDKDSNSSKLSIALVNNVSYSATPDGKELVIEFKKEIESLLTLTKKDVISNITKPVINHRVITESRVKTVSAVEENTATASLEKDAQVITKYNSIAKIKTLTIEDSLNSLNITISGEGSLEDFATLELTEPSRLILDIWDAKNNIKDDSILVASNSIDSIDILEQKNKVRFIFNSRSEKVPAYDLETDANNIQLAFRDADIIALNETEPAAKASAEKTEKTEKKSDKLVVTGLDFEFKENSSKVVVTTNSAVSYEVKEGEGGKITLAIENVRLPKKLSRFLDTSAFESNITRIEPNEADGGVNVVISIKDEVPFNIIQDENKIYVEVENPYIIVEKVEERVIEKKVPIVKVGKKTTKTIKKKKKKKTNLAKLEKLSAREKKQFILDEIREAYADIDNMGEESDDEIKVFTGTRMSMDFKDADIHNILRLIAEVSGFNVVTSDDVSGKVTIHLSNVPWDQALDVILGVKDLGMIRRDNILLIVPQARIKAEEERKKAMVKAMKEEKLEEIKRKKKDLDELRPIELKVLQINYADSAQITEQIRPILSEKGTISVDTRTNVLIIKDYGENIEEAEELIAKLDSMTPQVLIEARIVEANTNFTRQFGIQWGTGYTMGPQYGNTLPFNFPNSMDVRGGMGGPNNNYFVDLPASVSQAGGGAVGFSFGHIANTMTLDMRLSAMESSGEGKIVSSPRIVTLDNTQAVIQQGTAIPYETTSESGTETEFVDANLSLTVTPHITADGSVRMEIKASKNAPNLSIISNGQPAIDKKEAETEILVKDGETTVIGGIFVVDESTAEGGVPFLKDLPLIGWMFKTDLKIKTRSELLIFITPHIIKEGDKVKL